MALQFEQKPNAKFKFMTNTDATDTTTLDGINASLSSATTICEGVSSLMAIGNNVPAFNGVATRTVTQNVYDDE